MSIIIDYGNGKKEETFKGCVISTFEENGYHDSDFYAKVWNEEKKCISCIEYDSTRYAGYGEAIIDITKENYKKAVKYSVMSQYRNYLKKYSDNIYDDMLINKMVTVIKGRKVKIGTRGKVIGIYENSYDRYNKKIRLLLEDGTKVYTYANNIEKDKLTINEKINIKLNIIKYISKNGIR